MQERKPPITWPLETKEIREMLKTALLTTACRRTAHSDLDNCMLVKDGILLSLLTLNTWQKGTGTEDKAIVNLPFTRNKCSAV